MCSEVIEGAIKRGIFLEKLDIEKYSQNVYYLTQIDTDFLNLVTEEVRCLHMKNRILSDTMMVSQISQTSKHGMSSGIQLVLQIGQTNQVATAQLTVFGQTFEQMVYFIKANDSVMVPYTCRDLQFRGKHYREEFTGILSTNTEETFTIPEYFDTDQAKMV